MKKSKFYDFLTKQGNKTINVNNIASIEALPIGTKITLNVKDVNGQYISYLSNLPWSSVASDIKFLDENQN